MLYCALIIFLYSVYVKHRKGSLSMTIHTHSRTFRLLTIIALDIISVALVLVVFALFHHVLPNPRSAMSSVITLDTPAPSMQEIALPVPSAQAGLKVEAPPKIEKTPEPGDFSATFPDGDTGVGALYSYQSDTLKIAINQVEENGITYYAADVWIKNISSFSTAFAKGQYGTGIHQKPLKMADENSAIFAMTGDYYGARNKGVVIRNGDLYRDSVNSDVCVVFSDGVMETYAKDDFDIQSAISRGAWQAWGFGPQLLENGQAIPTFKSAIEGKNPRNAMGYYEPGHYCFVTVDGRQKGYSVGMTLTELSELFAKLGCKAAFNLDGGATAEMIFRGQLVNKPFKGGRESSDILCFKENT